MPYVRSWIIAFTALAGACSGGGIDAPTPPDPVNPQRTPVERLVLKTFAADCSDFLAYAAGALTEQYLTRNYCFADGPCPVFAAAPTQTPMPGDATAGAGGERGPDRVSGTNTQEAGVDEADIVKADAGGRLYLLSGRQLHVLAAFPPEGLSERALTSIDLSANDPAFFAGDLFLDEAAARLVVLGSSFDGSSGRSVAVIFDLADPLAPAETQRIAVEGWPLQARRIDARVHRASRYDVPAPAWFYDGSDPLVRQREDYFAAQGRGDAATATALRAQIRGSIGLRVADAGAAAFLPRLWRQPAGGAGQQSRLDCAAISRPDVTAALGLVIVDSFDTDGSDHAASAVVNNAYQVYASARNLYLVQSSFGWFFAPQQREETAIYRLALADSGAAAYRAVGVVDGTVNSAYQLSEYDGALRVASTERRQQAGRDPAFVPYNHVSVLDARAAAQMPVVGALRDLAPGETIQGARFVGPRGFVVTFRRVDPLFALDLSDPARPRVADELKIPGFSSYLMPLGSNFLLTLGRAGTDEQLTGGVAVQLFDVSTLSAIHQLAVLTPQTGDAGYSYSSAEYDPHAFSYFPDDAAAPVPGTLSIPLQSWGERPGAQFTGFLVLRVDPAAAAPLRELGRIDHRALIEPDEFCAPGSAGAAPCRDAVYAADPRRSVFMQDAGGRYVYTLSAVGLVASLAAQPETMVGSRSLPYDPPCCWIMPGGAGP